MNFEDIPYWGQLLIIAGVCAGLFYVFYQFMYSPQDMELKGMERRLGKLQDEVRELRPLKDQVDDLRAQIASAKETLQQLEAIFPSIKDDIVVKRFVEEIAEEYDISITSYRAGGANEEESYVERPVTMDTQGRMQDYIKFLHALSERDQVIHIWNFKMNSSTSREPRDLLRYPVRASFTIASYVYIPLEEEGQEVPAS